MPTETTAALDEIYVSPLNPRKTYDEAALKELAASIEQVGVLQPVLVRANGNANGHKDKKWELIFGTRRFKASKLAKLEKIPVRVVEMDDQAVVEAAVIENGQRQDIHPLEEAEGYERLAHPPKGATYKPLTVDEIAAKVNKSRSWVYSRMKLLELTPANRERFYAGKLDASRALLLARIPNAKLQDQAGKEIEDRDGREWSYRDAQSHVVRSYMLRLADAPFDIKDATLVPKAGACGDCPKRTGAQAELFSDVDSADLCTDPVCFAEKKRANADKIVAEAKAAGQAVLPQAEAKKLFRKNYADKYSFDHYQEKFTVAKDDAPAEKVVLARAPDGEVHRLVPKPKAKPSKRPSGPAAPKVDLEELAQFRGEARAMEEFAKVLATKPSPTLWRAVLAVTGKLLGYICGTELARRTIGAEKVTGNHFTGNAEKTTVELAAKMKTPAELQAFLVCLTFSQTIEDGDIELLAPAFKAAGVDLKAHLKKATDEIATAAKPAKVLEGKPVKPEFAAKKKGSRK